MRISEEVLNDFIADNKHELEKEFIEMHEAEFSDFCRDCFRDSLDLEETERSLWNDRR